MSQNKYDRYKWVIAFPPLQYANVRELPTTQAPVIGRVYKEDLVRWYETLPNGWSRIAAKDGKYDGWVFSGVGFRPALYISQGVMPYHLDYPVDPHLPLNERGWPGEWYDATGFARYYEATGVGAYHTGADLNLAMNMDKGALIYAIAPGIVLYAQPFKVWGNIIVIKHDQVRGMVPLYTRYAHMENMMVEKGERVTNRSPIGVVGDAFGRYSHHLHFDMVVTDVLETKPTHWPGANKADVLVNYVDPAKAIFEINSVIDTEE